MTDSQEDLVRLAQEGQQYKALAAQLAEALELIRDGNPCWCRVRYVRLDGSLTHFNGCVLAFSSLTKYRDTVK